MVLGKAGQAICTAQAASLMLSGCSSTSTQVLAGMRMAESLPYTANCDAGSEAGTATQAGGAASGFDPARPNLRRGTATASTAGVHTPSLVPGLNSAKLLLLGFLRFANTAGQICSPPNPTQDTYTLAKMRQRTCPPQKTCRPHNLSRSRHSSTGPRNQVLTAGYADTGKSCWPTSSNRKVVRAPAALASSMICSARGFDPD